MKYTGLCIVYVPRDGMEIEDEDSEDGRPGDARTSPDVWKTVNCSTKRLEMTNGDKK